MRPSQLTLFLFSLSKLLLFLTEGRQNGVVVNLVHRDSPISPFYNHSASASVRLMNSLVHSMNRANNVNSTMLVDNKFFSAKLHGSYHMDIPVGSEKRTVKFAVDTTSDFTSVKCSTNGGVYDTSTTYADVPYDNSPICAAFAGHSYKIHESGLCGYRGYEYFDGTTTAGHLGRDSVYLDESSSRLKEKSLVFGCDTSKPAETAGLDSTSIKGIIGLGRGPLSFLSQMGLHRFSYCLIPPNENIPSKMVFGSQERFYDGIVRHIFPPETTVTISSLMVNKDSKYNRYFLTLTKISINQAEADIELKEGNIWIDLRTDFILLPPLLYTKVIYWVQIAISAFKATAIKRGYDFNVCYRTKAAFEHIKRLQIAFHFSGGTINLPHTNTFVEVDEYYCLAMFHYNGQEIVFGNKAQQNFKIEYHLSETESENRISFTEMNCKTFLPDP